MVLASGPVVLAVSGGSPADVTTLFAAMALFRAPYILIQGSVAPLTVRLTRMVTAGDVAALTRIRRALAALTVLVIPLAWAAGAWLGPPLLRLVFGADVVLEPHLAGLVAVGCTLAVVNLLTMIDVLAHGLSARVAVAWSGTVVAALAAYVALSGLEPTDRTVWAFVVAEATAQLILLALLPRDRAPEVSPEVSPRLDRRQEHRRAERQVAAAAAAASRRARGPSAAGPRAVTPASAPPRRAGRRGGGRRRTTRSAAKNGNTAAKAYVERSTRSPAASTASTSRRRV